MTTSPAIRPCTQGFGAGGNHDKEQQTFSWNFNTENNEWEIVKVMPEGTDDEVLFSSSSKAFFRGSVTVLSGTGFLASRANHPYSGVADIANALFFHSSRFQYFNKIQS
jgi:hypothetical protein